MGVHHFGLVDVRESVRVKERRRCAKVGTKEGASERMSEVSEESEGACV